MLEGIIYNIAIKCIRLTYNLLSDTLLISGANMHNAIWRRI